MSRWRSVVAVAMTAGVVAGCSSSASEQPEDPTPTTPAEHENDESGPVQVKGGKVASASLSEFRCGPDDKGRWRASGTLANDKGDDVDFRVTVVVASPDTTRTTARQITVPDVAAGKPTTFSTKRLPVAEGDAPVCSVQVTRLR